MNALFGKRVVVTGGGGFLGQYVVGKLAERGCSRVDVPRKVKFDLRKETDIVRMLEHYRPEVLIHLAATVGGIGANRSNPGSFLYDNLMMGVQMIEQSRLFGVGKFVCVGTICSYPKHAAVPFRESELWDGYPEETNAPYGLAKKMLLVQLDAYRQQYGFNSIYLLPVNMYGPGDNFDLETSHVIPAIIRKCMAAVREGSESVKLWGTGSATREFIYAEDAAEAIVRAADRYDGSLPVNIGSAHEIPIRELAGLIAELTGFKGTFVWDASKPDGQPRRSLDVTRAASLFGFRAATGLREGLERTIAWYARTEHFLNDL